MAPAPLSSSLFRAWSTDVVEIKQLFDAHRYKNCAAQCAKLYGSAVHPVHKSFLKFYQALSYEILGTVAHVYSRNKLPLLHLAKDCFTVALQELPQALESFSSRYVVELDASTQFSPACATFEVVDSYQADSPLDPISTKVSPVDSVFGSVSEANGEDFQRYSSSTSTISATESVADTTTPDFDAYSPRKELFKIENMKLATKGEPDYKRISPDNGLYVVSTAKSDHKLRLSHSLSSNHCLVDTLVPSPLFRRVSQKRSTNNESLSEKTNADSNSRVADGIAPSVPDQSVDLSDQSSETLLHRKVSDSLRDEFGDRPLPPLPFNHSPHFIKQGSRYVLVPSLALAPSSMHTRPKARPHPKARASSIQALVTRFEDKIGQSKASTSTAPDTPVPKTPITPRFRMIRKAFGGTDGEETNQSVHRQSGTNLGKGHTAETVVEDSGKVQHHEETMLSLEGLSVMPKKISRANTTFESMPTTSASPQSSKASLPTTPTTCSPLVRHHTTSQSQGQAHHRHALRLCQLTGTADVVAKTTKHSTATCTSRLPILARLGSEHDYSSRQTPPSDTAAAIDIEQPSATYIQALESFSGAVRNHLVAITARIETVTQAQIAHQQESVKRSINFWSLDLGSLSSHPPTSIR